MSEEVTLEENEAAGLAGLSALQDGTAQAETQISVAEPKIDELGRAYATGRRKNASARVWVKRGSGNIVINGKILPEYFARPVLQMLLVQPFQAASREGEFDVFATVKGGGLSGQAGAVRHGISRASYMLLLILSLAFARL